MSQYSFHPLQSPQTTYRIRGGFDETKPSFCSESSVGMLDIHMRMVEEQEDAYWRTQFSREGYYVPGRGYDQYQPAYAMGCTKALQHPGADFQDIEQQMQEQWSQSSGSSLLPWREVRDAIQAAWQHTSEQILNIQQPSATPAAQSDFSAVIRPLYRNCLALADDLHRIGVVPMSDFAQQVLQRHIHMLRNFACALQKILGHEVRPGASPPLLYWSHRLHSHWVQFRNRMAEWEPAQVFELCEMRERTLVSAYQRALRKNLPLELRELLRKQMQHLDVNMDKLNWVRHNWNL